MGRKVEFSKINPTKVITKVEEIKKETPKEVKIEKIKTTEPREIKKNKMQTETRDTLVEIHQWLNKVSHYPIFQNWKTRNTPNPTWKPDGRIGQELVEKLKKILAETS